MIKLLLRFEELDKNKKIIITTLLLLLIGFIDYITENELSFSIFYLIPIGLAAWTIGKAHGIFFSIAGMVLWFFSDLYNRVVTPPIVGIIFWNTLVRLGLFLITSVLLSKIKEQIELEEELTHYIIHDLKSPLANMLSILSFLKEEPFYKTGKDVKEFIDLSINSGEKMMLYISSILDIRRIESKMMPISFEEVNLNEIVEASLKQISVSIDEKNISIKTFFNVKKIRADKYLLIRIITNLLSNAVKVSSENSEIILRSSKKGSGVEFHVIDQGPGIKENMKDLIFKKYSQLDIIKRKRREGTGLGLAFCKMAVEAHGGQIYVKNAEGGGADIFFALP